MIQIEQRPHMARPYGVRGGEEFALPQDRLFVDGLHVGYIGHHEMAPVVLITQVSPAVKAAIVEQLGHRKIAEPARLRKPRKRSRKQKQRIILP